jgi:DNA end-binding protein Ku
MPPRSIWNGTISFGAVHVPIKLYSADESKSVSFTEVHLDDGAKVEHRRFCSKEDKEVPYEEVIRGFETSSGSYVVLEKEEADAAAGDRTRNPRGRALRAGGDIDPSSSTRPTTSAARRSAAAYSCSRPRSGDRPGGDRALHAAQPRVPRGDPARTRTCSPCTRCASPTRSAAPRPRTHRRVRASRPSKEIKMAERLVETLHERFKPERYEDTYREAILDVVRRKAKGDPIEMAEDEEPSGGATTSPPRWRRAWPGPLMPRVHVDRVAELRARERAGRAVQRRARPSLHFRQLHEKDGAPIEARRFCSEEDKEIPFEAVATATTSTASRSC